MSEKPADTLLGATKSDIAKATIVGVFILIGVTVATGSWMCTDSCPTFTQDHFDRFVDMILYLALAGAIFVGLKTTANVNASSVRIPDRG